MTWFHVDDGFHSHPKTLSLFDGPCAGDAIALWAIAGSWCGQKLTDGHVPHAFVRRSGFDKRAAAELVRVRLWHEEEAGFVFHEWAENGNKTKAAVEAEREATRRRVGEHRKVKRPGNTVTPSSVTDEHTRYTEGGNADVPDLVKDQGSGSASEDPDPVGNPISAATEPLGPQIAALEATLGVELCRDAREGCELSRRNGKMADSVWHRTLQALHKVGVDHAQAAIRVFVERYADGSRDERYLVGIARNEATRTKTARVRGLVAVQDHGLFADEDPVEFLNRKAEGM
jgi:hypothetical protein